MQAVAASAMRIADLPGPAGLPLVGNAHQIRLPHFHQQLEAWREQYGDAYRIRVWTRRFVVIADPQLAAEALRDRPGTFGRTARVSLAATEMGFGGLFASNGERWRRQRPMVMAAFDPGHVRRYFPALVHVGHRLAARWRRAGDAPIPLQADLMRYTVDVISGLAFGTDINTLDGEGEVIQQHMDKIFPALFRRTLAPFPYWRWAKLPSDRRLDRHLAAFSAAIQEFIAAARARMDADPGLREAPRNLIEAMLSARDRHGLQDDDVAANVGTMLLAGEDTTANTLAWMLYLLSRHRWALERATAEVRRVLGDDRVPARIEQLEQLEFIDACAHETMRLKPVAPLLPQQAARDTTLGGIAIPAGTMCIFLMRAPANDAKHFPHPAAFDPDRWLREDAATTRRVSMPFGAGPRMCPGRYLALLEIKMAMATLLGGFDLLSVAAADGGEVSERLSFTLTPTPLAMRLRAR
ncbi:cytochrome P450 [Ramlibacter sp. USB13]|uniref:Cytochrome P450 n=1 Tax=Ramlibacter cellulosilyticus TaxID=2764187 RepID=A0A923SDJ2_9BURK|nr:cytochrome P450 [Ramlibacter cellulosilyticus]MBC5785383.1 cytochrome P450 [Ramlibacter cellulosilyticus]